MRVQDIVAVGGWFRRPSFEYGQMVRVDEEGRLRDQDGDPVGLSAQDLTAFDWYPTYPEENQAGVWVTAKFVRDAYERALADMMMDEETSAGRLVDYLIKELGL